MSATKRKKTYYKVSFIHQNEVYQICARTVGSSDIYGLIEMGEFLFPENKLVYNPSEERIRKEFLGIERTWIPYNSVIRIDEVQDNQTTEIKIVPLESPSAAPGPIPLNKRES